MSMLMLGTESQLQAMLGHHSAVKTIPAACTVAAIVFLVQAQKSIEPITSHMCLHQ